MAYVTDLLAAAACMTAGPEREQWRVPAPFSWIRHPSDTIPGLLSGTAVLARAGFLDPLRPTVLPRALAALLRDGLSPAAAYGYSAARYPSALALADEHGTLTFREAAASVAELAAHLRRDGVASRSKVALLCRNHNGIVLTAAALSSVGADVVLMNTAASPGEVAAVVEGQGVDILVYDEELEDRLGDVPPPVPTIPVWRNWYSGARLRRFRHGRTAGAPWLRSGSERRMIVRSTCPYCRHNGPVV